MSTVTIFPNAKSTKDPRHIDSSQLVEYIRDGRWKGLIEKLNTFESDSDEQKKFKSSNVPGIVWQGKFTERNDAGIDEHSGLVAIDIDHMPEDVLQHYRELLIKNKHTHILFRSPRRNGLKVIVKIPPSIQDHKAYVGAIGDQYKKNAGKYYDHFDDISRLCFVSYDPDIYYNPDSEVFTGKKKIVIHKDSPAAIAKIPDDIKGTFKRLAELAWKKQPYDDGNKHRALVCIFGYCNSYGIPKKDAINLVHELYSNIENVEPVSRSDYENRAESVYNLYSEKHGKESFEPLEAPKQQQTQYDITDPVSYFNATKMVNAKMILKDIHWIQIQVDKETGTEIWQSKGSSPDECSATFDTVNHVFKTGPSNVKPFEPNRIYTPFQILVMIRFKGNYRGATEWITAKYFTEEVPYIRVGIKYFKKIVKMDRFGIERVEIKLWSKDEIREDHGTPMVKRTAHFDDFTIVPNNFDYKPVINNCYNLYREFTHKAVPGEWKWTDILLHHIFGEQYNLGIRYLQILYLHPDRLMPILVLVSRERQTGKTTFVNWLNMIFGDNMANISPSDLINDFNGPYVASNIIAVEETLVEKDTTVEKIKALATSKFTTVNEKYISQYRMPFYGKIILTSNNEDKFARIDQEEIRFFIRKVPEPTVFNHNIEKDMIPEIPAFLHHLLTLPPVDWTVDRTGFTPQELNNDMLQNIKDESRSGIYKSLVMKIEQMFLNECSTMMEFYAEPDSLKDRFFSRDPRIDAPYIRRVLKLEFHLKPLGCTRYRAFGLDSEIRVGRPFLFKREDFTDENVKEIENLPF